MNNVNMIDKVQEFLEEFIQEEYELQIRQYKLQDSSRNDYIDKVYDLCDKYLIFSSEDRFNNFNIWPSRESEEERNEFIHHLRPRKVFVIEQYENAKYRTAINNENPSNTLFFGYVSEDKEKYNNEYSSRFAVTTLNGELKIIAVERKRGEKWKEYGFTSVEKYGTLVNKKKITAPSSEEDLVHYESVIDNYEDIPSMDINDMKAVLGFLESGNALKIRKVIEGLRNNAGLREIVEKRYLNLVQARLNNPIATIEDFPQGMPTTSEIKALLSDNISSNYISYSYMSDAETKLIVDFIGAIVKNHLDIEEFIERAKMTTYIDIFQEYTKPAKDIADVDELLELIVSYYDIVRVSIQEEVDRHPDGWYGQICTKLLQMEIGKVLFEKTQFGSANGSLVLKEYMFFLGMATKKNLYMDIHQSDTPELTEVFWLMRKIPELNWSDVAPKIPKCPLSYKRGTSRMKIGDEAKWKPIECVLEVEPIKERSFINDFDVKNRFREIMKQFESHDKIHYQSHDKIIYHTLFESIVTLNNFGYCESDAEDFDLEETIKDKNYILNKPINDEEFENYTSQCEYGIPEILRKIWSTSNGFLSAWGFKDKDGVEVPMQFGLMPIVGAFGGYDELKRIKKNKKADKLLHWPLIHTSLYRGMLKFAYEDPKKVDLKEILKNAIFIEGFSIPPTCFTLCKLDYQKESEFKQLYFACGDGVYPLTLSLEKYFNAMMELRGIIPNWPILFIDEDNVSSTVKYDKKDALLKARQNESLLGLGIDFERLGL